MANTIVSNGSITANIETLRITNDISFTYTQTGSNVVATVANINSGSYQALDSSSLSDTRFFIASNEDASSSIALALDVAGTKRFAYLWPGDSVMVPWSGSSLPVFAQAYISSSYGTSALLQYLFSES